MATGSLSIESDPVAGKQVLGIIRYFSAKNAVSKPF